MQDVGLFYTNICADVCCAFRGPGVFLLECNYAILNTPILVSRTWNRKRNYVW